MARRPVSPAEARRRKAQKRLEGLNFTPQAARLLSNIFQAMRIHDTLQMREARLRAFSEIVKGK